MLTALNKPKTKPIHQKVGHGEVREGVPAVVLDIRTLDGSVVATEVETCYTVSWAAQVASECEALLRYWGVDCRRYGALRCGDKVLIMDERYGLRR